MAQRRFPRVMLSYISLVLLAAAAPCGAAKSKPPANGDSGCGTIAGRLIDNNRDPVSGAVIELEGQNGQSLVATTTCPGPFTATTKDDGSYRLTGVPVGRSYQLMVSGSAVKALPTSNNAVPPPPPQTGAKAEIATGAQSAPPSENVPIGVQEGQISNQLLEQKSGGLTTATILPNSTIDYVSVTAQAVAGPMGYVLTPTMGAGTTQSLNSLQQALVASQKYNFPSIVVYISATPLVNTDDPNSTPKFEENQETKLNPTWLDTSFTLSFFGHPEGADASKEVELPNACADGSVQIIGILPQQTTTAFQNSPVADAAAAVSATANALTSVMPAGATVSAATNALNVLFQDIFPPKPIAYEYSHLKDSCNFGWFFRQNSKAGLPQGSNSQSEAGEASLLGVQQGIVLLKTDRKITRIEVTGRSLSQWSQAAVDYSANAKADNDAKLFIAQDSAAGQIKLPDRANIDYENLTDLSMFPALIPECEAMKILRMSCYKTDGETQDPDQISKFESLVGNSNIVNTNPQSATDPDPKKKYVTNKSLTAFLTASGTPPQTAQAAAQPAAQGAATQAATPPGQQPPSH